MKNLFSSPEKIFLCVDIAQEIGTALESDRPKISGLDRLKDVLNRFVSLKKSCVFGPEHEFGLILLGEEPVLVQKPTLDAEGIMQRIRDLNLVDLSTESCDAEPWFSMLEFHREHAKLQAWHELIKMPFFYIDTVHIHGKEDQDSTKLKAVMRSLRSLNICGKSTVRHINGAAPGHQLTNSFAELLVHPLMRPDEKRPVIDISQFLRQLTASPAP